MKGQLDFLTGIISFFILVIGMAGIFFVWNAIHTSAPYQNTFINPPANSPIPVNTATQNTIQTGVTNSETFLNNSSVVLLIVMALIAIILGALTEASLAFAFISLILLAPEVIISFMLHDVFFALVTNSFLGTAVGAGALVAFQFFTGICVAIWALEMIFTFAK